MPTKTKIRQTKRKSKIVKASKAMKKRSHPVAKVPIANDSPIITTVTQPQPPLNPHSSEFIPVDSHTTSTTSEAPAPAPTSFDMRPQQLPVPQVPYTQFAMPYVPPFQHPSSHKYPKFSGKPDDVTLNNWLVGFEIHTAHMHEMQRIVALMYHVEGRALEWYTHNRSQFTSWPDLKNKMSAIFNPCGADPLTLVDRRVLRHNEDLSTYYFDKLALLSQTSITTDEEKIGRLTDGLRPLELRDRMLEHDTCTLETWFRRATAMVTNYRNKNRQFTNNAGASTQPKLGNGSRKPGRPCRHCTKKGKTEWHYDNKCPSLQPKHHAKVATEDDNTEEQPEVILNSESGRY